MELLQAIGHGMRVLRIGLHTSIHNMGGYPPEVHSQGAYNWREFCVSDVVEYV